MVRVLDWHLVLASIDQVHDGELRVLNGQVFEDFKASLVGILAHPVTLVGMLGHHQRWMGLVKVHPQAIGCHTIQG